MASQTSFYDRYLEELAARYPQTAAKVDLREKISPNLLCPTPVRLPKRLLARADEIAQAHFALRNLTERKKSLEDLTPPTPDPGNYSALMSFDFHIDQDDELRLIEINTNASMALMSDISYRCLHLPNGISNDFPQEIIETFRSEYASAFPNDRQGLKVVVIADEKPEEQRLYIEFLLYQELFKRYGIDARVADPRDLKFEGGVLTHAGTKVDLVYNRHTDFYLQTEETRALREAVDAKAACVSPHPHEYKLLADKERLLELSSPGAIESLALSTEHKEVISKSLIRTRLVSDFKDADELWAERKKWFFKPKRSFGGKAAYRGSSVARPVFQQILAGDYLAQEFVPPSTMTTELESGAKEEFKVDLRFFAYKNRIQLACARLYKGQMTNTQTPGGGVAAIEWI